MGKGCEGKESCGKRRRGMSVCVGVLASSLFSSLSVAHCEQIPKPGPL